MYNDLDLTLLCVLFVILVLLFCAGIAAYLAKMFFKILKTFITVEILCELDDIIDEKLKALNDARQ